MYIYPYVLAVLFKVVKLSKQTKCPTDEWIKRAVVHLHNGILCSSKKKKLLHFAEESVDLDKIVLSE